MAKVMEPLGSLSLSDHAELAKFEYADPCSLPYSSFLRYGSQGRTLGPSKPILLLAALPYPVRRFGDRRLYPARDIR